MKIHSTILMLIFVWANSFCQVETDSVAAEKLFKDAYQELIKSNYPGGLSKYREAKAIFERIGHHERALACLNKELGLLAYTGKMKEAIDLLSKEIKKYEELLGDNKEVADSYNIMGVVYGFMADYDRSLENFEKCLDIQSKLPNADSVVMAATIVNIGGAYQKLGKFDDAVAAEKKAIRIYEKSGGTRLGTSYAAGTLGQVYLSRGNYHESVKYFNKAIEVFKFLMKSEAQPDVAQNYIGIANAKMMIGETESAIDHINRAIGIYNQLYGEKHYNTGRAYLTLAAIKAESGDLLGAKESYLTALEKLEQTNKNNLDVLSNINNGLAILHLKLEQYDEAKEYLDASYAQKLEIKESNHPDFADLNRSFLQYYLAVSDLENAEISAKNAIDIFKSSSGDSSKLKISAINLLLAEYYNKNSNFEKALEYSEYVLANSAIGSSGDIIGPIKFLEASFEKSKALLALKTDSNSESVINLVDAVDTVIIKLRKSNLRYQDKLNFGSKSREIYLLGLEACFNKYTKDQNPKYLEKAHYYSQRAKSSSLKNQLERE